MCFIATIRLKVTTASQLFKRLGRAKKPAQDQSVRRRTGQAPFVGADSDDPVTACDRYLRNRLDQLDYQGALQQGLPIGSGEIESAHRYIIYYPRTPQTPRCRVVTRLYQDDVGAPRSTGLTESGRPIGKGLNKKPHEPVISSAHHIASHPR